jgi:putative membrane protein
MATNKKISRNLALVNIAAQVLIVIVALLHFYFFVLESFLWATPYGEKNFKRTHEEQMQTKVLAQNQGYYNAFLAAGLVWSFFVGLDAAFQMRLFILISIFAAGIVGGLTAAKKIFFVQSIPAAIALVLVFLSHPS